MNSLKSSTLRALFLLSVPLILSLTGCGGTEPEAEQPLEERVLARWAHLTERDFEAAWEYYSPGFRQTNPRDDFARDMNRRPIRWLEAEVVTVDCAENVCDVLVSLVYQAVGAPSGLNRMRVPTRREERWIRVDGQWWYMAN